MLKRSTKTKKLLDRQKVGKMAAPKSVDTITLATGRCPDDSRTARQRKGSRCQDDPLGGCALMGRSA